MGLGDKVPGSMIIILELEGSEAEGKSEGNILGIISLPGKRAMWQHPSATWGCTPHDTLAEEGEESGSWITVLNCCSPTNFSYP